MLAFLFGNNIFNVIVKLVSWTSKIRKGFGGRGGIMIVHFSQPKNGLPCKWWWSFETCCRQHLEFNVTHTLKMVIWVIGVLRRTVVGDWRFDNLSRSHLQSNNSPSQDSNQPDNLFQSLYVSSGCKLFSYYTHYSLSTGEPVMVPQNKHPTSLILRLLTTIFIISFSVFGVLLSTRPLL